MPPKKGRKRRPRDRRHGEPGEPRPEAEAPSPPRREAPSRSTPSDLPKLRVRMAGFVLAVITMLLGIVNVYVGLNDGSGPTLVIGILLVALSLFLGVLALVPERVRALLTRR